MSQDLTQYVTTKQAAEMLGVAQDHVNRLLIRAKLRGIKPGYSWPVYLPSIKRYLQTKSSKGMPTARRPIIQAN